MIWDRKARMLRSRGTSACDFCRQKQSSGLWSSSGSPWSASQPYRDLLWETPRSVHFKRPQKRCSVSCRFPQTWDSQLPPGTATFLLLPAEHLSPIVNPAHPVFSTACSPLCWNARAYVDLSRQTDAQCPWLPIVLDLESNKRVRHTSSDLENSVHNLKHLVHCLRFPAGHHPIVHV